jgi:hypothetical protein
MEALQQHFGPALEQGDFATLATILDQAELEVGASHLG